MAEDGIRSLHQNASAVVADATSGETVTITDQERPVAQMTAIPSSRLQGHLDSGRARPATRDIRSLSAPDPGPNLSSEIICEREEQPQCEHDIGWADESTVRMIADESW